LSTWRLSVEGNVERPLQVGFEELVKSFKGSLCRGRQSVFGEQSESIPAAGPWCPMG